MFGYLQVHKSELLVREYEAYKSVYCGLCKQMGKDYSFLTRLSLSYDCTFYAMLLMSLYRSCSGFDNGRCRFNPLKKCSYAHCEDKSLSKAAAFSVISVYYKLIDDIHDSKFFKRIITRLIKPFFSHWHKKAAKNYPELEVCVADMMQMQSEAEENPECGIDEAAHPTANMLSRVLELEGKDDIEKRVLSEFGYHLGRWIYLMDACDDLEKDIKKKNFNPFKKKYNGDVKATMQYCNEVLNMTAAQLIMAYELLDLHRYKAILDNIIYNGITMQQKKYTFDRYNKKKTKDIDYYPAMDVHE